MTKALTIKQTQFVEEYLRNGGNATQAVIVVYKCSYNSARTSASRMLTNANIQEAISNYLSLAGLSVVDVIDMTIEPVMRGLNAKLKDGRDDIDTQLKAHDRAMKLILWANGDPNWRKY